MSAPVDKRQFRIRRMFGQIAPWYDFLNHLLSLNIDRAWRRRTTKLVPAEVSASAGPILDLCTGTGDLALAYDQTTQGRIKIIGADFCHEMLLIAHKKADRKKLHERIDFIEADAMELPFCSDVFQIVCVSFGLRNIQDTERGLAEMVRVAKPGGRVAILEFSKPRGRIIGPIYRWYFRKLLPLIGQIFSRNSESAYNYLPQSVLSFPDYEALAELMTKHGLVEVQFTPFTFGIATLYVGKKPEL